MVDYSIISAEIRRAILQPSLCPATAVTALASTRSLLDFQVIQWQKNLPRRLQFRGVHDKFDPSQENRGEYRLRLMLYLRTNQMRIVIHRKSAMSAGVGSFDTSTTNILAEISQDSIRVLIGLARDTDIYHAQHRTFNHFLETALTSLLLLMCYAESEYSSQYLPDALAAMDLVQQLSLYSPITRALEQKLQGVQEIVKSMKGSAQGPVPVSHGSSEALPFARLHDGSTDQDSPYVPHNGPPTVQSSSSSSGVPSHPSIREAPSLNNELGIRNFTVNGRTTLPNTPAPNMGQQYSTSIPQDTQSLQANQGAYASTMPPQRTSEPNVATDFLSIQDLGDLPSDFFTTQFPDLGDILKDYDNFRF